MDRLWNTSWDDSDRTLDREGDFTLPSRNAAIEALRPALRARSGPLLVTGDAGVGKSWLWRRLRTEVPTAWRWVGVDLSPGNDAAEFYRMVGHGLGLADSTGLAGARLALADFLKERAHDGDAWILVVDEAHGLADAVLEEIRVLSNRLGQPDGFAGLVLVGQTPLARRLGLRALASLASRIAARVHLRPLDFEEARTLLDHLNPDLVRDRAAFERLHQETAGNPKQLLRLARPQAITSAAPRPLTARAAAPSAPPPPVLKVESTPAAPSPAWDGSVLGVSKPPLRVEDGLIEVGWDPEPVPTDGDTAETAPSETPPVVAVESEEAVNDHYAALQAWNEWARNQGRTAVVDPADPSLVLAAPTVEVDATEPLADEPHAPSPDVWADGQQTFAPYSQLFSRVRQRNDSN